MVIIYNVMYYWNKIYQYTLNTKQTSDMKQDPNPGPFQAQFIRKSALISETSNSKGKDLQSFGDEITRIDY